MPTSDSPHTAGVPPATASVELPKVPVVEAIALMLALLVAVFAFQLNASMLSPALKTMEVELETTEAQIGLTQTAFFGRRKVLVGMLAITAVGCVISAIAPNVTVLFVGRVIQGVCGPTISLTLIMLRQQVPNEKQYALLMGILASVNGGIAGVDALAGGWLAGTFGFRSIFWVMAVICAIGVVSVRLFTRESTAEETMPMDWLGVLPLTVSIGSLLIAFNEAGKLADANWLMVVGLLVLGGIGIAVFLKIEAKVPHPLVTVTYLKQRRTWALLSTTVLTMTSVFAVMNGIIPNLAQDATYGPGVDTNMVSWYTLTPYALAGLVFGPIAGTFAAKLGYKRMLQIGLVGMFIGLLIAVFSSGMANEWVLLFIAIFMGVTYAGTVNIMLSGLGIVLSPADNQGYLPGMNAGAFNLGAGISFAALFAVVSMFKDGDGGYAAGIIAGAIIAAIAFCTSMLIPKPETIDDTVAARDAREALEKMKIDA